MPYRTLSPLAPKWHRLHEETVDLLGSSARWYHSICSPLFCHVSLLSIFCNNLAVSYSSDLSLLKTLSPSWIFYALSPPSLPTRTCCCGSTATAMTLSLTKELSSMLSYNRIGIVSCIPWSRLHLSCVSAAPSLSINGHFSLSFVCPFPPFVQRFGSLYPS